MLDHKNLLLNRILLNGDWEITHLDGENPFSKSLKITGNVPGLVHHDLVSQGILDDPYEKMNELDQQWVGGSTWSYEKAFWLKEEDLDSKSLILHFDTLDTVTEIKINEDWLGSTDNYFLQHRFEAKSHLKVGENRITVVIYPASLEMNKRAGEYPLEIYSVAAREWFPKVKNFLRKPAAHGGWDWGPSLNPQGIPGNVYLEKKDAASIRYVTHSQIHSNGSVQLEVTVHYESVVRGDFEMEVCLDEYCFSKTVKIDQGIGSCALDFTIEDPNLWWPVGLGEPYLYDLRVRLDFQENSDTYHQKIGLRELRLLHQKEHAGVAMFFEVNGKPVFAKGTNWIPTDIFESRIKEEQIRWELESAKAAHNNMIRVWGGGRYERDVFYQICDELGLMVWQDFMFACAMYPVNESFVREVKKEVTHQIRHLSHHASIALWCGNNENEQAISWEECSGKEVLKEQLLQEYHKLYVDTIHPIVLAEDPSRDYWPSSPSNGIGIYEDAQDPTRGDVHFWSVWHGQKDFSYYRTCKPRFSSEFGFGSLASQETMNPYISKDQRFIDSEQFEFHQRSNQTGADGNQRIKDGILREFGKFDRYESTIYLSQALQMLAIQTACEHWRRCMPYNMGTLIWQLNDIWPGSSWSSLEFDGRWKMLHYAMKRFFAPTLISCFEEGKNLCIWLTSDCIQKTEGIVRVSLCDFKGNLLMKKEYPASTSFNKSYEIVKIAYSELEDFGMRKQDSYVLVQYFSNDDSEVSRSIHLFDNYKELSLEGANVRVGLRKMESQVEATIQSENFVPFLWLKQGVAAGTWSDNAFHLIPQEKVLLTFSPRRFSDLELFQCSHMELNSLYLD